MRKGWKIFWLISLGVAVLFFLLMGIIIYNVYQGASFYNEAENLQYARFGSEPFNEKLKNCELSYGGSTFLDSYWEINGLENGRCLVMLREPDPDMDCYNNPDNCGGQVEIRYRTYVCELPYEVYSNLNNTWSTIISERYCEES